jgi:hypothetical protein
MRTSAKILRTIGSWLTSPAWGYAAPRHLGPWYHYYLYRYPSRSMSAVDLPGSVPGLVKAK